MAAGFGVIADVPTIGVAKSLLCGSIQPPTSANGESPVSGDSPITESPVTENPVTVDGRVVGTALKWGGGHSGRPLYVSPGQKIDVPNATRLTTLLKFTHRLPEPIYWADRLSRAESRRPA